MSHEVFQTPIHTFTHLIYQLKIVFVGDSAVMHCSKETGILLTLITRVNAGELNEARSRLV